MAFPLAVALARRKVGLADFTDRRVRDPEIVATIKKIEVVTHPSIQKSGGNEVTARIDIELRDGRRLERTATLKTGADQKWISRAELRDKFRDAASRALSNKRIEALGRLLPKLDQLKDIAPILSLVRQRK